MRDVANGRFVNPQRFRIINCTARIWTRAARSNWTGSSIGRTSKCFSTSRTPFTPRPTTTSSTLASRNVATFPIRISVCSRETTDTMMLSRWVNLLSCRLLRSAGVLNKRLCNGWSSFKGIRSCIKLLHTLCTCVIDDIWVIDHFPVSLSFNPEIQLTGRVHYGWRHVHQ